MENQFKFKTFGSGAAKAFLENGVPLNKSIEKIATSQGLNKNEISRVAEQANVDVYLNLIKKAEDNYVVFDLADPKKVHRNISDPQDLAKVASYSGDEFEDIKEEFDIPLFVSKEELEKDFLEKVAYESSLNTKEMFNKAEAVRSNHEQVMVEAYDLQRRSVEAREDIKNIVKQAHLLDENDYNDLMYVVKEASGQYYESLQDQISEFMSKHSSITDFEKVAFPSNKIIDEESPLFKKASLYTSLRESLIKKASEAINLEVEHGELTKKVPVHPIPVWSRISNLSDLKNEFLNIG